MILQFLRSISFVDILWERNDIPHVSKSWKEFKTFWTFSTFYQIFDDFWYSNKQKPSKEIEFSHPCVLLMLRYYGKWQNRSIFCWRKHEDILKKWKEYLKSIALNKIKTKSKRVKLFSTVFALHFISILVEDILLLTYLPSEARSDVKSN